MIIPTLETERLRLRPHRAEDLDASAAMWGDPIVTRHIGGRPFTREEVWARLLRYAGHWSWKGYGFWAIEDRESRLFVGEIGLADFKRELDPPLPDVPEAGWVLTPAAQGKGYATEALLAVIAWHDRYLMTEEICCLIDPANAASIRVANKCGFTEANRARRKGVDCLVFTRRNQALTSSR